MALVAEEQEPFVFGILSLPKGFCNHNTFSRLLRNLIFSKPRSGTVSRLIAAIYNLVL
jgi:hypothetical protein